MAAEGGPVTTRGRARTLPVSISIFARPPRGISFTKLKTPGTPVRSGMSCQGEILRAPEKKWRGAGKAAAPVERVRDATRYIL